MLVVPASMKVLGNANWWIPDWLDRLLPNLDIEGSEADEELNPPPRPPTAHPTETAPA
jgi:RND superfamily putative drug exporter